MTNEDKRASLITSLIEALVDDPRRIELDARTMPRRVNWTTRVDINDTGKVIGTMASHLEALRCLISLMGIRYGEDWRFNVAEPEDGERVKKGRIPEAKNWNCQRAYTLLTEILDAVLDMPATVEIVQVPGAPSATFIVRASAIQDYERLAAAREIEDGKRIEPVSALGTLFRAIGRQQGARISIEVPSR